MNMLNLNSFGAHQLSDDEMITIFGGDDGHTGAYNAGYAVGTAVRKVGTVLGLIAGIAWAVATFSPPPEE